jgi:MoxR-like ATPase
MSAIAAEVPETAKAIVDQVARTVGSIILGKEHQIRLALTCILAKGHLLIEDLPGVGKTTLSHALAQALGLHFQRIQFTSDLLPADICGVAVFDRASGSFEFHPGPVFAQFILADEINRATPKTQSALLEAMEERQVTVEGATRPLPEPFFVIATQNPAHQIGTFPLPESQVDRFLMRIELGYPDSQAERELLRGSDRREMLAHVKPILSPERLLGLQRAVAGVHVSDALIDYLQALLETSRQPRAFQNGLSPRAGLAILRSAQAWALLDGRDYVVPEDIQAMLPPTVGHRLHPGDDFASLGAPEIADALIKSVPVP